MSDPEGHNRLRRAWRLLRTGAWLIITTTQFLAALITFTGLSVLVGAAAWLLGFANAFLPLLAFGLGVASGIAVGVGELIRRPGPKRGWISQGYRWAGVDYHYQLASRTQHSHDIRVEIQAIRAGIDHFENRYQATASRTGSPQARTPRHRMIGQFTRGAWTFYLIDLGRELGLGERETIHIHQEIADPGGTFVPFLAKTVVEPIGRLKLRITFAPGDLPIEARRRHEDAPTPSGKLVEPLTVLPVDPVDRTAEWVILQPKLGHRYAIEWDWQGQTDPTTAPSIDVPVLPFG